MYYLGFSQSDVAVMEVTEPDFYLFIFMTGQPINSKKMSDMFLFHENFLFF